MACMRQPVAVANEPTSQTAWVTIASDKPALKPGGTKGRPLAFAVGIPTQLSLSDGVFEFDHEDTIWTLPIQVESAKSVALKIENIALPSGARIAVYAPSTAANWQTASQLTSSVWHTPHVEGSQLLLQVWWTDSTAAKRKEFDLTVSAVFRGDF